MWHFQDYFLVMLNSNDKISSQSKLFLKLQAKGDKRSQCRARLSSYHTTKIFLANCFWDCFAFLSLFLKWNVSLQRSLRLLAAGMMQCTSRLSPSCTTSRLSSSCTISRPTPSYTTSCISPSCTTSRIAPSYSTFLLALGISMILSFFLLLPITQSKFWILSTKRNESFPLSAPGNGSTSGR